MKRSIGLSLLCTVTLLSGCFSPKSFVDPAYHKASYEAIQRISQPIPVKLETHFQRNGKALPAADGEFRGHVERSLRATSVFVPSTDSSTAATISVTGNNIADLAAARSKGFGTGLTFGAAGSMVDDNYEFLCTYQNASGPGQTSTYKHAIHSTIGNTTPPAGLTATTPADAFGHVVEDVVLNFVKDLQDAGLVVKQ